jgi:hypothetical protein
MHEVPSGAQNNASKRSYFIRHRAGPLGRLGASRQPAAEEVSLDEAIPSDDLSNFSLRINKELVTLVPM